MTIKHGDAFVLIFSLTSPSSLDRLKETHERILELRDPTVPMILIGNKADDTDKTTWFTGNNIKEWGIPYLPASAKEGLGVEESIKVLVRHVILHKFMTPMYQSMLTGLVQLGASGISLYRAER